MQTGGKPGRGCGDFGERSLCMWIGFETLNQEEVESARPNCRHSLAVSRLAYQ